MKITQFLVINFILFFTTSLAAQTPVECTGLWMNGFPDTLPAPEIGKCMPFYPAVGGGPQQELFFHLDYIDNTDVKQRLEWAAEALEYSENKYSAFLSVPKVKLVFYSRPYFGGGEGTATPAFTFVQFFALGVESCPIILYPDSLFLSKDHFYQMIAHELFHCVQKVNFPDQVAVAVNSSGEQLHWFEGLAQFFSNLVYPHYDFEYHRMFGTLDPSLPFFQQDPPYQAEPFYQSYFNFTGESPSNLANLMSLFPTSPGSDAADAVMSFPRVSEGLRKYAQELTDRKLRDSSGAFSSNHAEANPINVTTEAHSEYPVSFFDFSAVPYKILLPKRGKYRLSLINRPDGGKVSFRKVEDSVWSDSLPTNELVAECDQDREFLLIITRADPGIAQNTVTLSVDRDENTDCACDVNYLPADRCLFGNWNVDHSSVIEFLRKVYRAGGIIPTDSQGLVSALMDAEGNLSWQNQGWVVNGIIDRPSGPDGQWRMELGGLITNKFSTGKLETGERVICTSYMGGAMKGVATMTFEGRTITMPAQSPMPAGDGLFKYTCNESTFEYLIEVPGQFDHWMRYTR